MLPESLESKAQPSSHLVDNHLLSLHLLGIAFLDLHEVVVVLFGLGVEQDADGHRHGAQPTEEGDGVAKENHRDPDQERPLHRVGHAATIVQSGRVKQRVKHGNIVC